MSSGSLVVALLVAASVASIMGVHTIDEGHVGVYFRGGQLLNEITFPGVHFRWPVLDRVEPVQITMQTDSVTEIPCGTSGGVVIYFDRIEVVNRLAATSVLKTVRNYGVNYDKMWIFDKIHHEINQFCSSHSLREVFIDQFDTLDENLAVALQRDLDKHDTGIEIITVRVTKPRIPESVRRQYELIEAERANQALAMEHQRVVEREAETHAKKAKIEAATARDVRQIELEKEVMERNATNAMHLSRERAIADAAMYRAQIEAEANKLRITPEMLRLELIRAIGNMSKVYYGEKIPAMFPSLEQVRP